jgi:hypothetical protein
MASGPTRRSDSCRGARQRFCHFRGANPAGTAGLLGYSVLQLVRGALEEVDPTKEFHAGDRIKIRIEPNSDGYST